MYSRVIRSAAAVVLLVALVAAASGCGSGLFGLESGEDKAQKEWSERVEKGAAETGSSDGEVLQYAADEPVLIWKAGNDGGIDGGGGTRPEVIHDSEYYVTEIATYHSGYGPDAPDPSGTISLKAEDGTVYGPWETTVRNRAYWIAVPNQVIPAGTYTLIDSDPSTWAQNAASGGTGMGWAYGVEPE